MKVLQIDTTYNAAPTGRFASGIGDFLISHGHESFFGYGRTEKKSRSVPIKIGDKTSILMHILNTRLFDRHGFGSKNATRLFIDQIREINPDIVHLHNIHGYYINVEILFDYLHKAGKPVVWTLHDCWSFTGHCSYFDRFECYKWKEGCYKCPAKKLYPSSWFVDNSRKNYRNKKELFTSPDRLVIVTPSLWLFRHAEQSFLNRYPLKVINVGIDLEKFRQVDSREIRDKYDITGKHIILGVASVWSQRKGLTDFIQLRSMLDPDIEIVLAGLTPQQIRDLPAGINGISRTENIDELVALYSAADVFLNPTYMDNFPATNLEALACGTPVITYKTGGSPEAVSDDCGLVVKKGDIPGLVSAINEIIHKGKENFSSNCRSRAVTLYDRNLKTMEYLDLYNSLL